MTENKLCRNCLRCKGVNPFEGEFKIRGYGWLCKPCYERYKLRQEDKHREVRK